MAFDTFVVFDPDVKGETQDESYKSKGAFEILSFSFGAHNPTTVGSQGSGLTGGKVSISSFNILKKLDASSPALFHACCAGGHFKKVTIVSRKASGGKKALEFLFYTLTDVMVESIQFSGSSGGDDTPTESLSLAFGEVKIEYQKQKADGTEDGGKKNAGWSVIKNVAI